MKRFGMLLAGLCCLTSWGEAADLEVKLYLVHGDGTTENRTAPLTQEGNVQYLKLEAEKLPAGLKTLEIRHPHATAQAGEDGFYVFSSGMYGTFRERANGEYRDGNCVMPMFGVKTPRAAMTVITTGMRYEQAPMVRVKEGNYEVFQRFNLNEDPIYEDIQIEYHQAPQNATYADLAKIYRNFQIQKGIVKPLKERVKENPELKYAAESMEVRVRMGWKPVPSPVGEQDAENEPPMKVVITFDRMNQIIDEFQKQGVDKAEFCLVGWNIGGHDGRYPQIFPVDERLGGEAKLRETIAKAQKEGYQIVCHTNNSDAYRASQIGGLWDENYLLRKKDGHPNTYTTWGGGNMYETCPKCMYERFVAGDFAKLKELGFRGMHYVDVFSTVNPRTCYSPEHPLTREGYAHWTKKIFADAQKTFGGLGSEGGFDYCIENLDYALYISFFTPGNPTHKMIDRHTPFWHLVYNGIVLNNPYTKCANYTIKDPVARLKLIEFGGRPMFYFYSKFKTDGKNWMGDADITCATDEELVKSVQAIKEGYDEFEKLKHLQYEFMEGHDQIAENVFRTTFSDGTAIITNYNEQAYDFEGQNVPSMGYIVVK
ncbi:MAG: DUF5696 domain-containing protein [Planctomycetia bacterium]|nr:DUF5696 domain-containing protein [Planctomycetia bacterium]